VVLVYQFFLGLETKLLHNFIQRKLPSPGFQVEVVLVDYDGSQPPKPKPATGPADNKSDADSSASTVAKENNAAPAESNKGTGSNDKDEVFSDSDGEDGSSKGRKEKIASGGQNSVNAAKPSETSNVQKEVSAAASRLDKVAITSEQGTTKAPDASLKTEVSSKTSSLTTAPPTAADNSSMSEFKAIAADASVFSFGDEEDYESE
jgi:phosphatidylinositol-3,4,5-trisphosphate 3-phosphatase/dual-specificity protein phosphatase PTEN